MPCIEVVVPAPHKISILSKQVFPGLVVLKIQSNYYGNAKVTVDGKTYTTVKTNKSTQIIKVHTSPGKHTICVNPE